MMGIGDEKWVQIAPLWYEDEMVLLGSADGQENLQGFAQIPKTAQEGQIQALDDFFVPSCEGGWTLGRPMRARLRLCLTAAMIPMECSCGCRRHTTRSRGSEGFARRLACVIGYRAQRRIGASALTVRRRACRYACRPMEKGCC